MSRNKNSGRIYQVIEGEARAGQIITALNREQEPQFMKMGKICVWVEVDTEQSAMFPEDQKKQMKKILIDAAKVKHIGFFD